MENMNLTNEELERFYYMSNHPLHNILGEMVDLETQNYEQYWEIDKLEKRIKDLYENE
jgi:hypothetical protein